MFCGGHSDKLRIMINLDDLHPITKERRGKWIENRTELLVMHLSK